MVSCHIAHTVTRLITKVKQRWARIILGWVTYYHSNDQYTWCCKKMHLKYCRMPGKKSNIKNNQLPQIQ
jgi:hypothetical protein